MLIQRTAVKNHHIIVTMIINIENQFQVKSFEGGFENDPS